MKIVEEVTLIKVGAYADSEEWCLTREILWQAIREVEWPPGSGSFTIYPQNHGNGVTPIKDGLMINLAEQGWKREEPLRITAVKRPGELDAVLYTNYGPVALEWETGNISSSHRALNKMAVGLLHGVLACGLLVVPSRAFYKYLTDRVGNIDELVPYFDLWRSLPVEEGVLEIVVIEHDSTSINVPRIMKGTDGRALA
jgi:hypothetical protein